MTKFIEVKSTPEGYQYAQRKGKDSVAFILYDAKTKTIGLINEYKPPIGQFLLTAFGGSFDKDISPSDIVKEEVAEEAGYLVETNDIIYVDRLFVSTQMNQFCYLYMVDISKAGKCSTTPKNKLESISKDIHFSKSEPKDCWKARIIYHKLKEKKLV